VLSVDGLTGGGFAALKSGVNIGSCGLNEVKSLRKRGGVTCIQRDVISTGGVDLQINHVADYKRNSFRFGLPNCFGGCALRSDL